MTLKIDKTETENDTKIHKTTQKLTKMRPKMTPESVPRKTKMAEPEISAGKKNWLC